jgi:hypothetical protein
MANELRPIDISNTPELLRLAEEVQATGKPRMLVREREELAVLVPVESSLTSSKPSRARDRRTSQDDPLWQIIGIGDAAASPSDPTDVSENKYKYLAEAYDPTHQ